MFVFGERSAAKCVASFESHWSEWCVLWAGGPLLQRGTCGSCWCWKTIPRCESDVLESSEPPAAPPTSACPSQPIRGESLKPWRISLLGNLFRGSWWRDWNKSQPPPPWNPPAESTLSYLPTIFWLWYLRPLCGRIASPVHTTTHPTSIQLNPYIMTEKWGGVCWAWLTYIYIALWEVVCVLSYLSQGLVWTASTRNLSTQTVYLSSFI